MSVLLDLSIFPVDRGTSLSRYVAPVVNMISASGYAYQLTSMGTQVETETLTEALALIDNAHNILAEQGCERVYATAKFDIRAHQGDRLSGKVASIQHQLQAQNAPNTQVIGAATETREP